MLKFSKVIALNSDLETSQSFVFSQNTSLDDQADFNADLYLAVLITGEGENVFSKVRSTVSVLNDSFFQSKAAIAQRIEEGLELLKTGLKDLEELQIVISAWKIPPDGVETKDRSANVLYLQSIGTQKVYLLRDEEVIDLLNGSNQLISGYLKISDKLLFLNNSLNDFFDKEKIESILKGQTEDLEGEVNGAIFQIPHAPPLSAIMIDYQEAPQKAESVINVPERVNSIFESLERETPLSAPPPKMDIKKVIGELKSRIHFQSPQNPKIRIFLAAALVVFVLLLGLLFKNHQSSQKTDAQFQALLVGAEASLQSAQSLKDTDPDGAKKSLIDAQNNLSQALKLKPTDSQAADLKKQIDQESPTILKITNVTNWPLFLDLNLIKQGFSTDRMTLYQNELLLLDTDIKSLVMISLDQKNQQILAGPTQMGNPVNASINSSFAFVNSADKGIVRIDTQSIKAAIAVKADSDWGEIKDVVGFADNIYLLDSIKNQIWKYTPNGVGYSDKAAYLKDGTTVDFSGAKRMEIDSSVWVLKDSNEIDRYTSGSPDYFSPGGLDKPIKSINSFFVSGQTDNIYLLDSADSRVVILKKNGEYVSQITGDKFKDATDLVVDEQSKNLYLLESSKIYQISLP